MHPALLEAGVYSSRPLAPLRDAVTSALGSPTREEVRRGLEVGPLWRDPVLRGRIVHAVCSHARRSGAGRVVAADAGILPLASVVAARLGVPLEQWREDAHGEGGRAGPARYLVARVLHDGEEGRRVTGVGRRPGPTAGTGVLIRIGPSRSGGVCSDNMLSIIEL